MELVLTHRGTSHPISLPADASTKVLMDVCRSMFLDMDAATMKLVAKGQVLKPDSNQSLDSLGIESGCKILLAGTTRVDVDSITKSQSSTEVMDDLNGLAPVRAPKSHYEPTERYDGANRYGFGAISVIEAFADHSAAFDVLYRVATHPGVLGVMKSRRWFVPVLSEMYPDGKVGVDPVCVLGLNKNKGQEICLRLRTDDLMGFRKFAIVMKTMWHELAHNEISEHTGKFYDFVSELTTTGDALDWTKSAGHRLSDEHFHQRDGVTIAINSRYSNKDNDGPTSGVVGGKIVADPTISVADLAARAAAARRVTALTADTHPAAAPTKQLPSNDAAALPPPAVLTEALPSPPIVDELLSTSNSVINKLGVGDELSGVVIDCLTRSHSVKEALTTLQAILSNVLAVVSGDATAAESAKFLKIRASNPAFVRKTAGSTSATNFLKCSGFAPDALDPSVLVFPIHDDVALSALFTAVGALQDALIEHG